MSRYGFVILNTVCFLFLLISSFLFWQYLTLGASYIRSDLSIFHKTLIEEKMPYKKHYFVYPTKNQENNQNQLSDYSEPQTLVNLNTPLMNVFIKGLLNVGATIWQTTFSWLVVSLLLSILSVFFLIRYVSSGYVGITYLIPIFLLLWLSWPNIYNQVTGEVASWVLFSLSLSFLLGYKKKDTAMAVLLGFTAAIKLFVFFFLVFFLLRKQFRLAMIFLLSFLFFFLLGLFSFSWSDYAGFFLLMTDTKLLVLHSRMPSNGSLFGFFADCFALFHWYLSYFHLKLIVSLVSMYVFFRWIVYYFRFLKPLPLYEYDLAFSFSVVLMLFLSPLSWIYYYLLLAIPTAVIMKINRTYRFSFIFYTLFGFALLFPMLPWLPGNMLFFQVIKQFSSFLDLIFWLLCLHWVVRVISKDVRLPATAPSHKTFYIMMTGSVLLGLFLLSMNYGFACFFEWHTQCYQNHFKPARWVEIVEKKDPL